MSAFATSVAQASPSRPAPARDPPRLQILSAALTLLLVCLLLRGGDTLAATLLAEWKQLLFWSVLVMFISFFPITVDDALLTLDEPILLALALLYPPEVAALVALSASVDVREFKGQIVFPRAMYNRAQVGLSVYLAGSAFRAVTDGDLDPWLIAIMGTAAAVAAEYFANVLLVSLHARVRWRLDFWGAVRKLKVGETGQFLATYLGYGTLALVLAHLFQGVGAWSVATFLVPILVARQMFVRGQALQSMAEMLRNRDRLLEKVSDRILDERRDERIRLAGDLHDDVLQALTKIWLSARLLEKQQGVDASSSEDLKELIQVSECSIESLRRVVHDLKESPIGGWGGLVPNLRSLVRNLRLEWKANIQLRLPDAVELEPATEFVAYQIAREALINSLKHAHASVIVALVRVLGSELVLVVEDDGVGFSMQTVDSASHFGIDLMDERTRSVGGNIRISSVKGHGTQVTARFPK